MADDFDIASDIAPLRGGFFSAGGRTATESGSLRDQFYRKVMPAMAAATRFNSEAQESAYRQQAFETQQFALKEARRKVREERQGLERIGEVTAELSSVIHNPELDPYAQSALVGQLEMKYAGILGRNEAYRSLFAGARAAIAPKAQLAEEDRRFREQVGYAVASSGGDPTEVLSGKTSATGALKILAGAREAEAAAENKARVDQARVTAAAEAQAKGISDFINRLDADYKEVLSTRPLERVDADGMPIPGIAETQLFDTPTRARLESILKTWTGQKDLDLSPVSDKELYTQTLAHINRRKDEVTPSRPAARVAPSLFKPGP